MYAAAANATEEAPAPAPAPSGLLMDFARDLTSIAVLASVAREDDDFMGVMVSLPTQRPRIDRHVCPSMSHHNTTNQRT
jgi:hypothetical protein